jgi:RNA-splicing ligase RtcB
MIEVVGTYNKAICYTNELDGNVKTQIRSVCDLADFSDSKIRIMPDVHLGVGCAIGTTMTISDKIIPNLVGVDIGCGMETVKLADKDINYEKLDGLIYEKIPSGRDVRSKPHALNGTIDLNLLRCAGNVNLRRARLSLGSLGGGNHFIEIDRSEEGDLYLVVHSGSRNLGKETAGYYQDLAFTSLKKLAPKEWKDKINELKAANRQNEINEYLSKQKKEAKLSIPKALCHLTGKLFDDYIHDMTIIQSFADLNRKAMCEVILTGLGLTEVERFSTVHNYVDTEAMILRKGAVSAKAGERLLIPINMRDGSLICVGKGNVDWNWSAPHGAGRLMSRKQAMMKLSYEKYVAEMKGIHSSSVSRETLDESPMAYKSLGEITAQITPTADIIDRIKPTYNFKCPE